MLIPFLSQTARIFQIPWKHAARHGWNIDKDATLFRNWAIHTGKGQVQTHGDRQGSLITPFKRVLSKDADTVA